MKKHKCRICGIKITCGNKESMEKIIKAHIKSYCSQNLEKKINYDHYKELRNK